MENTFGTDWGIELCVLWRLDSKTGVRGQYIGYNAPDDNTYVERVIRTVKEEEIWSNVYDTFCKGRVAIESYVNYYNE